MKAPAQQVPHFEVTDIDGRVVRYRDVWQRRNLLLAILPDAADERAADYIAALRKRQTDLAALDTALVITAAHVLGLPAPGVVLADRWGEIYLQASGATPAGLAGLPDPADLIEWVEYIQAQCPECPP